MLFVSKITKVEEEYHEQSKNPSGEERVYAD